MAETDAGLLSPSEVGEAGEVVGALLRGLDATLFGQERLTRLVLTGALARGHVLLDGLPGLGKTELVKALASLLGLRFSRVQFTADLLPSDITGGHVLDEADGPEGRRRVFVFHPGPIFANIVLADEINRASPKTQSALLEAMAERRVTVLGETRPLPDPFWVLATQNPVELEGTWPLPEAQLDRFLFKLDVRRVGVDVLERILSERRRGEPPQHGAVIDLSGLQRLFGWVERVHLPRAVARLIGRLVEATHPDSPLAPPLVKSSVRWGASPRAAIAIGESARAWALLHGKPHVGFDDVRAIAPHALAHRIVLDYRGRLDRVDGHAVCDAVLAAIPDLESEGRRGA